MLTMLSDACRLCKIRRNVLIHHPLLGCAFEELREFPAAVSPLEFSWLPSWNKPCSSMYYYS